MKWQFNVTDGTKNIPLNAELICSTHQIEEIKVTGQGISIILQNNRPLLTAIESKLPITWRLVRSELKDQRMLALIQQGLENSLKKPEVKTEVKPGVKTNQNRQGPQNAVRA